MAHAWNACWVNSPRGFKSPHPPATDPPVLDSKTGGFFYAPLVLFLQNPTVTRAAEAPHTCRKHHHDLQKSRRQPPLPPARHDPRRLGRNPAAAGTPRHPHHHPKTSTSRPYSPKTPPSTVTSSRTWSNGAANSTSKTACTARYVTLCTAAPSCTRVYWTWTPSPRHYCPVRKNLTA